ncbi:chloride channel protein [Hymenobacter actinosclerus]|uniref:H+/Cl-antiporter ClcA n=1 Tax=Hymenobacter actinosclerus TaxID=82805 RepID=A0A1I0EZ20_9BACT|nr:chloride channel protein [Hymenobacter actinosclerus]SET50793.1 H+/Cl-antiporter ClcA [Hymenobacter actinosclerus]
MNNTLDRIRKQLKHRFDAIDNIHLKRDLLNALPFWVGAFITGLVAVLYAKLFAWAEAGTRYVYHHSPESKWWFVLLTPLCFFIGWWLVNRYAPFARGSGIPQVTAAIDLSNPRHNYKVNRLLSMRVLGIKILSSLFVILGGGIIGREGPTIQISAAIFRQINRWLPGWYPKISKRNMIITGAAAGLASAFNTPLGGIVFAIEELTRTHLNFFKSALLTGVIIAGLTALNLLGPYLYLGYPRLDNIPIWMVFVVMLVAIIGGLAASGMGEAILFIMRRKERLTSNVEKMVFPLVCGLLIALLAILVDERILGSGREIMLDTLFTENKRLSWYVPVLRVLGSILTFSTGVAGGIFAPALSAGASIGAVVAGWMYLSDTATNLLVLCGMVGFLTGITRSPFTSSILVIEMTNSHNIIFYLMMTALLANLISNLVNRHGFYDQLKSLYILEIHRTEAQRPPVREKQEEGETSSNQST